MSGDQAAQNQGPCKTVNEAARLGSLSELKRLISAGHPVDAADNQGWRPLHAAAAANHKECVEELLQHDDTDVCWTSHEGYSALYLAAEAGHADTVKLLLDHGAEINQMSSLDCNTPLHAAVKSNHREMVQLLIESGANINCQQYTQSSPLHLAASEGRLEILETLLKAHARIMIFEDYNISPIFSAAHFGYDKCLKKLLEYAKLKGKADLVSTPADDGGTPLYIAAQEGYSRCVELLLNHGADCNALTNKPIALPLHAALQFARIHCVRHLLPNTDRKLFKYCDINYFDFATSHSNPDCLRALIEAGLDVNYSHPIPDGDSFELRILSSGVNSVIFRRTVSPLVSLALYRHPISNAEIMLESGALVNGSLGEVPPLLAALNEKNLDYSQMLVAHGASVDIYHPASCGNLTLIACLHYWKGLIFMLKAGADPTQNFKPSPPVNMSSIHHYFDRIHPGDEGSVLDHSAEEEENERRVPERVLTFYDILCQARQFQMTRRGVSVGMVLYQMIQYSANVRLDPMMESLMEDPRDWATLREFTETARSLSHLCRLSIRKAVGSVRLLEEKNLKSLPLPETLLRYLLYAELYEDH